MTSSMDKKEYLHWYQRRSDNQRSFTTTVKPSSSSINLNSGSPHFFNQHLQDPFPRPGASIRACGPAAHAIRPHLLIPCISTRQPPRAHAETGNIVVGGTKHTLQSIPDEPKPTAGVRVQQTSLFAVSGERVVPFLWDSCGPGSERTVFPTPDPRQLWGSADTHDPWAPVRVIDGPGGKLPMS